MGEAKRRNKKPSPFRGKGRAAGTVIVIAILIVGVVDFLVRRNNPILTKVEPKRTLGQSDAPLKIIEFIDFQCPECSRGSKVLKSFMRKYAKDIQLSVKYYPLKELNSLTSAVHAECAAQQNLFWPYYEELIIKQNQWRLLKEVEPYFILLARSTYINIDEFKICVEDENTEKIIDHEQRVGEAYFVRSTPTYFINGQMFVGVDEMEKYLNEYFENKRLGLL